MGDANGKFVMDRAGSFLVETIEPGTSLVVKETRAKLGYQLLLSNQNIGNLVVMKGSGDLIRRML